MLADRAATDESAKRTSRFSRRREPYKLRAGRGWRGQRKLGTKAKEFTMKLLYFNDFKLGALKGDTVVDLSAEVSGIAHTEPGDLMNALIEQWAGYKARLEAALARGTGVPVSSVR